jgi:hypothetical protein
MYIRKLWCPTMLKPFNPFTDTYLPRSTTHSYFDSQVTLTSNIRVLNSTSSHKNISCTHKINHEIQVFMVHFSHQLIYAKWLNKTPIYILYICTSRIFSMVTHFTYMRSSQFLMINSNIAVTSLKSFINP